MSITNSTATTPERIEILPNEEEGTVTFVTDLDGEATEPPTEWITAGKADLVDVMRRR